MVAHLLLTLYWCLLHVLKYSSFPPLANSDHNGLGISISTKSTSHQSHIPRQTVWRYAHADFAKASRMISETNWDPLATDIGSNCPRNLRDSPGLQQIAVSFENCVFRNDIHTEYFAYLQNKSLNMNIMTEYAVFERNRNPLYKNLSRVPSASPGKPQRKCRYSNYTMLWMIFMHVAKVLYRLRSTCMVWEGVKWTSVKPFQTSYAHRRTRSQTYYSSEGWDWGYFRARAH